GRVDCRISPIDKFVADPFRLGFRSLRFSLFFGRLNHEMSADTGHAWLSFQSPGNFQKSVAMLRIVPPFVEVVNEPGWSFQAVQFTYCKPSLFDFVPQFIRMVEEVVRGIAMLAVLQVSCNDCGELRILQESQSQSIDR